jgi:peptidoglycan/LPS O-acetylase OafA/YrhL
MISADGDSTNLDVLRSIAVGLVVASHCPIFGHTPNEIERYHVGSLGLLGVLLFFVHTSLVLMLSLERQHDQMGRRAFYASFLVRRVFRIYPLSAFVVVAVTVLSFFGLGEGFLGHSSWFVYNLLLVQNIPVVISNPAPLWSLPFEMQMYLFLPALYLSVRALRRYAPAWILALWLGVMVFTWILFRTGGRYDLVKFVPCFLPGILAYALGKRPQPPRLTPVVLFSLVAIAAVVYPILVARGVRENLLGPFICLGLGVVIPLTKDLPTGWVTRTAKVIAKYSYGVYLTHMWGFALAFGASAGLHLIVRLAIFAASVFVFPWLAYQCIEAPGQRLGRRLADSLQGPAQRPRESHV